MRRIPGLEGDGWGRGEPPSYAVQKGACESVATGCDFLLLACDPTRPYPSVFLGSHPTGLLSMTMLHHPVKPDLVSEGRHQLAPVVSKGRVAERRLSATEFAHCWAPLDDDWGRPMPVPLRDVLRRLTSISNDPAAFTPGPAPYARPEMPSSKQVVAPLYQGRGGDLDPPCPKERNSFFGLCFAAQKLCSSPVGIPWGTDGGTRGVHVFCGSACNWSVLMP